MGRKVVVELRCDRCKKVEHVTATPGEEHLKNEAMFECAFMGKTVTFSDLCTGCKEVVATHWEDITRDMKKVTPRRTNATREAAMARFAPPAKSATPTSPAPPPTPAKTSTPALGERKADSHGSSQRP